ncbi:hypothetical protein AWENTII_009332 [Aspergillus wentii]
MDHHPIARYDSGGSDTVNSWSETLASLSHPAAIYYGDDLVIVANDAWAGLAGEQRGLPKRTGAALQSVARGAKADALSCRDFIPAAKDDADYHVLLSQLPDATSVVVQLLPKTRPLTNGTTTPPTHEESKHEQQVNGPHGIPFAVDGFKQLANMLPVGLVILNGKERPVSINQRFHDLHPNSTDDFAGWLHSIHPDDRKHVEAAYHEAIKSKSALRIEYRVQHEEENLWRLLLLNPLDQGRHFDLPPQNGFVCTVVDITIEKNAALAHAKAAKEAKEGKKQQEQFIDMISHEIRNPLSAIRHCTEEIMDGVHGTNNEGKVDVEEIVQATDTINLCLVHQKKVVDDVLSFSKLDASMLTLSPRIVRPKVELPIAVKMFKPELRKQGIQFEYRLDYSYVDYGIDWAMADITRISQVVINLFSNAIKFTTKKPGEKKIALSLGASLKRPSSYPPNVVFFDSEDSAIRLDGTNRPEWGTGEEAYIMVAVSDTGIGISDESQRKLFERFNQGTARTEVDYGGSGLGLNVCRKLCHLHGGEIGVSSKKDQGSTFGFFIRVRRSEGPAADEVRDQDGFGIRELCNQIGALGHETVKPEKQKRDSPPMKPKLTRSSDVMPSAKNDERTEHTAGIVQHEKSDDAGIVYHNPSETDKKFDGRPHILLVEDNMINQRLLSRKLKSLGFDVSEANDGREALETVQGGGFACILMDKEMPVMDGIKSTRAIRGLENKEIASVPILGLTASVREEHQDEMEQSGMTGVVHKPYRTEDLVKRIRQVIDH